ILALKGLSSPVAARRGNLFGMIGMAIAVLVTLAITKKVAFILIAAAIGGTIGAFVAKRVQMTQMPQLVAAMHSLVGMAEVLIAGKAWEPFLTMLAIAFVLGVLIIIPIGGADMPVVISMLNSYSGWAAAGIGFSLNNSMLIIAGSLVGSSGAILSYIMCKAMNRSFISVIMGGFGAAEGAAAAGTADKAVRSGSA